MSDFKYVRSKYTMWEDFEVLTPVVGYDIDDKFFKLRRDGMLLIRAGFPWDGASGPTLDTPDSALPSAVHDAFCILMRDGRISYEVWQDKINEFFEVQCRGCGMPGWRATVWHAGVEIGDAGNPENGPDPRYTPIVAPQCVLQ